MPITLLIAEDHTIVRQGLRSVLEAEPDFSVVGEADDGLKVADAVDALHPDVVLLDLGLPGLHGLEVIRRVVKQTPSARVLVLSMHSHGDYVRGALRNGASGYLLKGTDVSELAAGIRSVAAGERVVSAELSAYLTDADLPYPGAGDRYDSLTDRERQVFELMATGLANADIGNRLVISTRTVETHRANVLRKLGLRGQTDVVRYAMRRGILPPE